MTADDRALIDDFRLQPLSVIIRYVPRYVALVSGDRDEYHAGMLAGARAWKRVEVK